MSTAMPEAEETCRICLETSSFSPNAKPSSPLILDEDRLISPCGCSGTQAFVHFKCLRKWQMAVMSSTRPSTSYTPALICSVCTQKFSVAPPRPPLIIRIWKGLTGYSCEVAGLCVVLCACYLVLMGHNLQSLLEELGSGLMLAREVLPCSVSSNIEEKYISKPCRWGTGRLNLNPGTLLVSTPAMPSPFFFGSVVLLYEHKRCSGSRGLILNMPAEEVRIADWERKLASTLRNPHILQRTAHGTGGPVARHEWINLNRCACCAALTKLSCFDNDPEKMSYSKDWGQEILPGIFISQDISSMFHHGKHETNIVTHQVLHGHAEWFVGQLWSEVKRGLWVTKQNASEILLATPPHELWHTLIRG